ncbi:hypothetical protein [Candidatus Chlorohelix sp.]|uniref:hypothetical protein n=1 Tax=Candidatus Chlorohelix sp. TaxID=3139201 RepID=UPI003045CBF3
MLPSQINLNLNLNYPALAAALEQNAEALEVELAERLLESGVFAQYASASIANTVSNQMVSLITVSLLIGDLTPFYNIVIWECNAVMNNQGFFKRDSDMSMINIFQSILLDRLDPNLAGDIQALSNQMRSIFEYSWREIVTGMQIKPTV